jgi:hypothetical protein
MGWNEKDVLSALSTLRRNHHWVIGYRLSARSGREQKVNNRDHDNDCSMVSRFPVPGRNSVFSCQLNTKLLLKIFPTDELLSSDRAGSAEHTMIQKELTKIVVSKLRNPKTRSDYSDSDSEWPWQLAQTQTNRLPGLKLVSHHK